MSINYTNAFSDAAFSGVTFSSAPPQTITQINIDNIDLNTLMIFKTYDITGTVKPYQAKSLVMYQDRTFIATSFAKGIDIPSTHSRVWREVFLPSKFTNSKTTPEGIKRAGDRWFNPITTFVYVYTKQENGYVWLCT